MPAGSGTRKQGDMSARDRELKPNAAGSNPDGPAPYVQRPDDTEQCPNCGLFDDGDAQFCDQCGYALTDDARSGMVVDNGGDTAQPWDTLQDPSCGRMNAPDAIFCDQCGRAIPSSAYAAQANGATDIGGQPVSSAGRWPGGSPAARRAWLDDHGRAMGTGSSGGLIEELARADDQLAVAEGDESRAADSYRAARADWIERNPGVPPEVSCSAETLAYRTLTPDDRHVLSRMYDAENTWERARQAADEARARRNSLLPSYEADRLSATQHPLLSDPDPDGLSPSDRARW